MNININTSHINALNTILNYGTCDSISYYPHDVTTGEIIKCDAFGRNVNKPSDEKDILFVVHVYYSLRRENVIYNYYFTEKTVPSPSEIFGNPKFKDEVCEIEKDELKIINPAEYTKCSFHIVCYDVEFLSFLSSHISRMKKMENVNTELVIAKNIGNYVEKTLQINLRNQFTKVKKLNCCNMTIKLEHIPFDKFAELHFDSCTFSEKIIISRNSELKKLRFVRCDKLKKLHFHKLSVLWIDECEDFESFNGEVTNKLLIWKSPKISYESYEKIEKMNNLTFVSIRGLHKELKEFDLSFLNNLTKVVIRDAQLQKLKIPVKKDLEIDVTNGSFGYPKIEAKENITIIS